MTWKTEIDHHGVLPKDWLHGCLVGRVWRPDVQGPSIVVVRDGALLDISEVFPTMRDLCEAQEPAASVAALSGEPVSTLDEVLRNTPPDRRDPQKAWLLAPIDLQAVKAAGVIIEGTLDSKGSLVSIPGSRDRTRRGAFHQGPADVGCRVRS